MKGKIICGILGVVLVISTGVNLYLLKERKSLSVQAVSFQTDIAALQGEIDNLSNEISIINEELKAKEEEISTLSAKATDSKGVTTLTGDEIIGGDTTTSYTPPSDSSEPSIEAQIKSFDDLLERGIIDQKTHDEMIDYIKNPPAPKPAAPKPSTERPIPFDKEAYDREYGDAPNYSGSDPNQTSGDKYEDITPEQWEIIRRSRTQ